MRGTTASGFEFTLEKETLNNWDVLDQLAELADGEYIHLPKFTRALLGIEQTNALVAHCRHDGVTKPMDVATEVFEIIRLVSEDGKN